MTVLMPNVLLSTSRSTTSVVNSNTVTGAAATKLTNVQAHIQSTIGIMHMLPASALSSEYRARVDSSTDIRKGDYITAITLLDGKTTWPGLTLASTPIANEQWRVVEATEALPGVLPYRYLYLVREIGGGPIY